MDYRKLKRIQEFDFEIDFHFENDWNRFSVCLKLAFTMKICSPSKCVMLCFCVCFNVCSVFGSACECRLHRYKVIFIWNTDRMANTLHLSKCCGKFSIVLAKMANKYTRMSASNRQHSHLCRCHRLKLIGNKQLFVSHRHLHDENSKKKKKPTNRQMEK